MLFKRMIDLVLLGLVVLLAIAVIGRMYWLGLLNFTDLSVIAIAIIMSFIIGMLLKR